MENLKLENMLMELLDQLQGRFTSLLALVKREQKYLIHSDLKKLEGAVRKKAALKTEIVSLEKNREAIVPLLVKKYGLDKKNPKLDDIVEIVPDDYKDIFKKKKSELKNLFDAVERTHAANEILIKKSVSFRERAFMSLFNIVQEQTGYQATGKVESNNKRNLVDSLA